MVPNTPDIHGNVEMTTKGINKGYILALLITVSLGTFQFGYSIGVFNTLQAPFTATYEWTTYSIAIDNPEYLNETTGLYNYT